LTYDERIIFLFHQLKDITFHENFYVNLVQNDILRPGGELWQPYHPKSLHDKQAIPHQLKLIGENLEVMIRRMLMVFLLFKE
jgi:hypothetical protein